MQEQSSAPRAHILAAVGEEHHLRVLRDLAVALAGSDGLITLLCVTEDGVQPAWMDAWEEEGAEVHVVVRAGDDPGRTIVQAVREVNPDLLLVGWSGQEGSRQYLLSGTLDPVIRYAPCDVAVVRGEEWPEVHRALVPAAGGPNASLSIELALRASPDAQVTALYIAREATGPFGIAAGHEQLTRLLEPWGDDPRLSDRVIRSPNVIEGILSEVAQGYDLLLVGASNESYIDRKLFGNVPQTIAERAPIPTLVVRRRAGPLKSVLRRAESALSDVEGYLTTAERVEAYREIRRGARPRLDFFMMIGFAAAIASLGLLMNSAAVIIGAMVIAPLMSAIFGLSMGIVQGDIRLLWQAAITTLRGAGLGILVGILVGVFVRLDVPTSEIMARAEPTLMDLVVALISGAAGAYAQCRRNVLGSLAGVAIAVALIPPLATTGIGVTMGSAAIAGGALLLFLTNLSAITAAGSLVFRLFGFRPDPGKRVRVFSRGMIGVLFLLGVVSVTLTVLTVDSVLDTRFNRSIHTSLAAELGGMPGVELESWQATRSSGTEISLDVQVRADRPFSYEETVELQERLASRLQRPVVLVFSVIQVSRLDPLHPPTPAEPPGAAD